MSTLDDLLVLPRPGPQGPPGPKGDQGDPGPAGETGVSDHGDLTGLDDDDHEQYALADGSRGAFASQAQLATVDATLDAHAADIAAAAAAADDAADDAAAAQATANAAAAAVAAETTARTNADAALTTAVNARVPVTEKGVANGVATLGADGKVPASQLAAIAITDTYPVASEAAMLALGAQRGDVAVRSDVGKSFILAGDDPAVLGNWTPLPVNDEAAAAAAAAAQGTADAAAAAAAAAQADADTANANANAAAAFVNLLAEALDGEVADRETADTALQANITAEAAARDAAIAAAVAAQPKIERGTIGARPAPGARPVGSMYVATDVNGGTAYETDGATWAQIGAGVTETGGREIASVEFATAQQDFTATADATGMTLAGFTVGARPVYVVAEAPVILKTLDATDILVVIADASNVEKRRALTTVAKANGLAALTCRERIAGAGTYTRKLRFGASGTAGTVSIFAGTGCPRLSVVEG